MNNVKRISLMIAIFLTVALVSSSVEAGVIRINGTIAGSESDVLFPIQRKGFMSMGASRQPTRRLVHSHCFIQPQLDFALVGMPPGDIAGIRWIVGDAANGDSILAWGLGN